MKTAVHWQKRSLQRRQTRHVILNLINSKGPLSRLEIAKRTNTRPSTVTVFVDGLIHDGLVREAGLGTSRGGRRPMLLEVDERSRAAVGIHVSRERMLAIAIDLRGRIIGRVARKPAFSDPRTLTAGIVALVRRVIQKTCIDPGKILGIGLGMPGVVDQREGIARVCTLFPWWKDIPVRERIEAALGMPAFVENDTKVLTLAEKWFGHGKGIRDMLFVEIGDGIAAGIVIHGELLHGAHGIAGELGHTVIDIDGDPCECGRRGCVESGLSLLRLMKRGSHTRMRRLIEEAGERLGVAIVNAVHLINPELVVVGGALGVSCRDILAPVIQRAISTQALDPSSRSTSVVFSGLGDDAGARGAATLALGTLFDVA